jgi:hypothetical protein
LSINGKITEYLKNQVEIKKWPTQGWHGQLGAMPTLVVGMRHTPSLAMKKTVF